MPHQCTNCGRTFPDGSKEMLSGCPDCGGNKFQFAPSSAAQTDASTAQSGDSSTPPEPPSEEATDSVAARAAETVRDFVSTDTNLSDSSETAGDVSSQPESSTETQATQRVETQTTPDTEPLPPTQAEDPSGTTTEDPSATGDKTDQTKSEEPAQNKVSDWTTASDSDDVPSSSGEFPEWPDSARPPEDRSTADSALEDTVPADSTGSTDRSQIRPPESPADSTSRDGVTSSSSKTARTDPEAEGAPPKRVETERTGSDQAGGERTHTEQTGSDRTDTDRTGSDRTDTDRTGSDRTDTDRTGSDRTDTDRTGLTESEDTAQASARSDVVPSDELPDSTAPIEDATAPDHGRVVSEPTGEQPSLEDLRAELNEQFESIKILKPGQYELNLMELYNREEYIISLQEDGRYVIDVPDSWRDGDEE